MSKRQQIISSIVMGSAVTALSVTNVQASQPAQINKLDPSSNLVAQSTPTQQPLVPNPRITIENAPTMPRAIAPPVGDIGVSNLDAEIPQIGLNSTVRVNMILNNTPARVVLESLARSANLNLAYADGAIEDDGKTKAADPTVSINLRNEPVQNAFNYVLQLSGLEANRIGSTIFVGKRLPDAVRETVVRTLRMNQVTSTAAANFLTTQGAEAQIPFTQVNFETTTSNGISRTVETRTPTILALKAKESNVTLLLKGLAISTDERLNAVTLIGSPRKVAMATSMLTRLDARRRQVAINVKIVDVNLSNTNLMNNSLSFKVGDGFLSVEKGAAVYNYGGDNPVTNAQTLNFPGGNALPTNSQSTPSKFLSTLQAQIISGNGKILTDPTLVVQEGQKSTVNLTQDVFGGFKVNSVAGTGATTSTREPIIKQAGLSLEILVNRIDDNGFVSVGVAPTVSSIGSTVSTADGDIALLQSRTLNSGEIRLRDGQTLILSGIIQESDRTSVTKVPILGDIPILGALFRSTNKTNQRQEVVVLLTPQILNDNRGQVNYAPGVDARLMIGK